MSRTLYEVAQGGDVVASFESREEATEFVRSSPGQIRVRAEKRSVPAAFAVYVDGEQVGDIHAEPGTAAHAARAVGGSIRAVPAE